MSVGSGKTVLITFGRSFLTLDLARLMGAAGHRVLIADSVRFPVTRFSKVVDRTFRVPRPTFEPLSWARAIADIARAESVDLVLTVHEETDLLAYAVKAFPDLFPPETELFLSDFDTEARLHNKSDFQIALDAIGVPTLKHAVVRNQEELESLDFDVPFALKQCYSRGSQQVHKVYPGKPPKVDFDEHNPWLAQEWMSGDRYCSYSICHNGKIHAHTLYPVRYAIDGRSCLTYEPVDHDPIEEWVRDRVKAFNFTGQIGFDFIDNPDRGLFAIECNPRATSGILLFEPDNHVDRAFFGTNSDVIKPNPDVRKMVGPGMLIYGWRKSALPDNTLRGFLRDFRNTDEIITDRDDLRPALAVPLAVGNILGDAARYRVNLPEAFMHDHEWDGKPFPI